MKTHALTVEKQLQERISELEEEASRIRASHMYSGRARELDERPSDGPELTQLLEMRYSITL